MMELTWQNVLPYAIWGALGSIVGSLATNRGLVLPSLYVRTRREDGGQERVLNVGFIATPLIGAFVAIVMDGPPHHSALWGLAVGHIGPSIISQISAAFLERVGIKPRETRRRRTEKTDAGDS